MPLTAQSDSARLQGTVQDSSGGVINAAKVIVTSTATGRVLNAETAADGAFSFPDFLSVIIRSESKPRVSKLIRRPPTSIRGRSRTPQ
ncbi:MAG: carboxypeptidase-like regulatory domain-containing protein [Paludibaculum sp.]